MAPSTKLALANALKKQLQKRFLDDITVKALVEDCEVNRQTFYYHFQDIYDLLRWFLAHETEEALRDAADWREALLRVFYYVRDNHLVIYHIYRSDGREQMENQLRSLARAMVEENLAAVAGELDLEQGDRLFLSDFYMYAVSGVLVGWLSGEMREEPEQVVDRLVRLLDGEFRQAAEKFARPEPAV